jgi:signal transduction histidine kinase
VTTESDTGCQGGHAAPVASPASIPTQGLHMSSPREALELIARRARQAVHANLVAILAEVDGGMHVLGGVDGRGANGLRGLVLGPANGSRLWRELLAAGRPYVIDNVSSEQRLKDIAPELSLCRLMMIPLESGGEVMGALLLASLPSRKPFGRLDLEIATAFARSAAEALELIRSQEVTRRMTTAEGSDRTARNLHDEVLQRLFAIGLYLDRLEQSVSGPAADTLNVATEELNATIAEIRTTIFSLRAAAVSGPTVRDELLDIALGAIQTLGFDVHLILEGTVDRAIPTLGGHLRATLEEALATIARQASATRVDVLVRADRDHLSLQIHDNGNPPPADAREAMLADGLRRIAALGGTLDIGPAPDDHGTILDWQAPIPAEARTVR